MLKPGGKSTRHRRKIHVEIQTSAYIKAELKTVSDDSTRVRKASETLLPVKCAETRRLKIAFRLVKRSKHMMSCAQHVYICVLSDSAREKHQAAQIQNLSVLP